MKKYVALLLCGAILVGFTACERESEFDLEENKNNIPAFCNELIGMSVTEADNYIQAHGFTANPYAEESAYTNKEFVAQMGPHTSTAGSYVYEYDTTTDEQGNYNGEGYRHWLAIYWQNGTIRDMSYTVSSDVGSLQEIALAAEEGLYRIAKKNRWEVEYEGSVGHQTTREDMISAIKSHSLGYCNMKMQATDIDFPQSLVFDDTAYGISYTQDVSVYSYTHSTIFAPIYSFSYHLTRDYYYIPKALYMPNDTIRVGEYLQKASREIVDNVVDETRVHYSVYQDKHFFTDLGDWYNGCYYACGMAFFAPAGAFDLEANMVTHTSSDETILLVEQDECQAGKEFYEKVHIKAVAPGTATLTVRWKDLSTTATITVIE